ncbi:ATP-binding protein [Patescibacteria group bacterium]
MPAVNQIETLLFLYIGIFVFAVIILSIYLFKFKKKLDKNKLSLQSLTERLDTTKEQILFLSQEKDKSNSCQNLFFHWPISVCILNDKGYIISMNQAALQLTNQKMENVVQKHFNDIFKSNKNVSDSNKFDLSQIIQNNSYKFLNNFQINSEKKKTDIRGIITTYSESDNIRLFFTFYDASGEVNKENKSKEKLHKLEKELNNLQSQKKTSNFEFATANKVADSINYSIVTLSKEKNIEYLNPYAKDMFGIDPKQNPKSPFAEIIQFYDAGGAPYEPDEIRDAFSGKKSKFTNWTFIKTKTDKVPIYGSIAPLYEGEKVNSIVLVFRDASSDYNKQTQDQAFFSGAAHDLRTPLASIRGLIELLVQNVDSTPKDKLKDMLTKANDSIIDMVNMVNQLLNVSRIDMGRLQISKEAFDIVDLTKKIIDQLKLEATKKNIYIKYKTSTVNIPKAYGDKEKTEEIITNLISNAIKYTQQGGVTVTHKKDESVIITKVTDTGIGISPQNQGMLFHKFQQIGSSKLKPTASSTGMGLYISKKFAELTGGNLKLASSEPEKGSVFEFSLPIA